MLLILYFLILLIVYRKYKSVVTILILLQVISLAAMFVVGRDYPIDTPVKLFQIILTAFVLTIVIVPWKNMGAIQKIYCTNEHKIKNLTIILLIISFFVFIVLLIIVIAVALFIQDMVQFRNVESVMDEFLRTYLPSSVRKASLLAYYLYQLSYFLIPLHFYYLSKRNFSMAILCFIMSLNIILFGLTFFSRASLINYFLIYGILFYMFKDTLGKRVKRNVLIGFIMLGIWMAIRIMGISSGRFDDDIIYRDTIPSYSKIQDNVVLYNYLSYMSQWYYNGMEVLDNYKYETMRGEISFNFILNALSYIGIVDYEHRSYIELRQKLLLNNWDQFIGLVPGWIYDFGYLVSLILAWCYNYIIRKLKPYNNSLSISNALLLVLLIQIPLFSIFYSALGGILYTFLLWIPINLYLRERIPIISDINDSK